MFSSSSSNRSLCAAVTNASLVVMSKRVKIINGSNSCCNLVAWISIQTSHLDCSRAPAAHDESARDLSARDVSARDYLF